MAVLREGRITGSTTAGIIRTARPRQWLKNLLVFVAPAAAGVLTHRQALERSVWAFAIFCLAASATYFMNDAFDAAADAQHPTKRQRPVAAGIISRPLAWSIAGAGLALSAVLGTAILGEPFGLAVVIYGTINLAYGLWLKREPILDIAAVASGFLLRAIAGGLAVHVPLSDWFLIVSSFGSLFVVAGKREADLGEAEAGLYSQQYLRSVRSLSAAVAITAYCLWAFGRASTAGHNEILFELTIAPLVLALLRYALLIEAGQGGTPEDLILGDWVLMGLGLSWVLLFLGAIYA
jgi:decaprenyl-phosphate phosphoribosyltransferase